MQRNVIRPVYHHVKKFLIATKEVVQRRKKNRGKKLFGIPLLTVLLSRKVKQKFALAVVTIFALIVEKQ
jgi:hypothetical protein